MDHLSKSRINYSEVRLQKTNDPVIFYPAIHQKPGESRINCCWLHSSGLEGVSVL